MSHFTCQWVRAESPEEMHDVLLRDFAPTLADRGYTLTAQDESSLTFTGRIAPTWAVIIGILTLPTIIGLFFFFIKETHTIHLTLKPEGEGTRTFVNGSGPSGVRKELSQIPETLPVETAA